MATRPEAPPIEFVSLDERTICAGLKCTNQEINDWFARDALRQHAEGHTRVMCAVEVGRPERPLGFYALAVAVEEVRNLPGVYRPFRAAEHFAALHLVWLATDRGFTNLGIGTQMVGHVIEVFAEIGPTIGLPHLILTPHTQDKTELIDWYAKRGFRPYKDEESMFLSLEAAIEVNRQAEALIASEGN